MDAQAPTSGYAPATSRAATPQGAALALAALAVLCALALAAPAQTVTTRYLPDLLHIFDLIHRVAWGDAPGRDFVTPLGPLAVYLPAWGWRLSGSYGAAMPTAMALATLAMAPLIVHATTSRLHPLLAALYGALLILIVAVPANLGESVTALSFAKYYNRIGWAAIGALLVLHLAPRTTSSTLADAACAALLALIALATKATYGAAAVAFLLFMLTDARQRRWAAAALAALAVATLGVAWIWGGAAGTLAALQQAAEISGVLRGAWGQIVEHVFINLADYVVAGLLAGLALARARSLRDALFFLACGVGGFWLVNQNFQAWGIITLHAAAVVAAERILRADDAQGHAPDDRWTTGAGAKLLFALLVAPPIVHFAITLALHAGAAAAGAGRPAPLAFDDVRLADMWTGGDLQAANDRLDAVQDGARALAALRPPPACVVTLDLENPFSAALGLRPARGDAPWLQWERTLGPSTETRASALLAGALIVMEPKPAPDSDAAREHAAGRSPAAVFAQALRADFAPAGESERWIVHRRRGAAPDAACGDAPPGSAP